jgi:DNA invertase Pin-like site-specific DNA recombinase
MLAPYEDQPPIKCPLCGHDRASHIPQDHKWLHQYTLARMVEERSLLAAAEFKRGVPQAQVAEKYHLSRYQVYRAIQKLERALKESQREG